MVVVVVVVMLRSSLPFRLFFFFFNPAAAETFSSLFPVAARLMWQRNRDRDVVRYKPFDEEHMTQLVRFDRKCASVANRFVALTVLMDCSLFFSWLNRWLGTVLSLPLPPPPSPSPRAIQPDNYV